MKYEDIEQANSTIRTTTITSTSKKTGKTTSKEYAEVNQRIKAFRIVFPTGYIHTHFFSLENGVCVMLAEVGYYDENGNKKELGTGTAYEKEGNGFINANSYIENCETSAVGRALGMCGFGIDTSLASYEEVANANEQQVENEIISTVKANALIKRCENDHVRPEKIAEAYKVKNIFDLTEKQYSHINLNWEIVKEKCK